MSDHDIYRLTKLPLNQKSIRVFNLHPGNYGDPIQGELELWDGKTSYEALSWSWGDDTPTSPSRIMLQHERSIEIRANLHSALQRIRSTDESRKLWVDAICINQRDTAEKNDQVPQMSRIYERAAAVLVWLGEPEDGNHDGIELLKEMSANLGQLDVYLRREKYRESWKALLKMMNMPWFERKWIVQEIALASNAIMYYGSSSISWKNFRNISQICKRRLDKRAMFSGGGGSVRAIRMKSPAIHLITLVESIIRSEGRSRVKRYNIETVAPMLSRLKVSVPHDNFYGVLALCKDSQFSHQDSLRRPITVNYGLPYVQVCREFVELSVRNTGSLDALCHPWVPATLAGELPSWTPAFDESIDHSSGTSYHLVGTFLDENGRLVPPRYPYEASGSTAANADTIFRPVQEGDKLRIYPEGFILDCIHQTGSRYSAQSKLMPEDWVNLSGWPDAEVEFPERLWRALIANRWTTQDEVQDYYGQAFEELMSELVSEHKTTAGTPKKPGPPRLNLTQESSEGSFARQLRVRIQDVCHMRRLFVTRDGRLGLAPDECVEGDLICILSGCSVPVALRKVQEDEKECYAFLGACYVHDMMQGEAMDLFEAQQSSQLDQGETLLKKKMFELV